MANSILITDDSRTMRTIIRRALRQAGFEPENVFEAEHGRAALDTLEKESIDIIFTDINMPEMNGVELIQAVRASEKWQGIPIVVISTESADDFVQQAMAEGANQFLSKPFTPEQVKEKLAGII